MVRAHGLAGVHAWPILHDVWNGHLVILASMHGLVFVVWCAFIVLPCWCSGILGRVGCLLHTQNSRSVVEGSDAAIQGSAIRNTTRVVVG